MSNKKALRPLRENEKRVWVQKWQNREIRVKDICSELNINRSTFYAWKNKYAAAVKDIPKKIPVDFIKKHISVQNAYKQQTEKLVQLTDALQAIDGNKNIRQNMSVYLRKKYALTHSLANSIVGLPPAPDEENLLKVIQWLLEYRFCKNLSEIKSLLASLYPDWKYYQIKRIYEQNNLKQYKHQKLDMPKLSAHSLIGKDCFLYYTKLNLSYKNKHCPAWLIVIVDIKSGKPLEGCLQSGYDSHEDIQKWLEMLIMNNGQPSKIQLPNDDIFKDDRWNNWFSNISIKIGIQDKRMKQLSIQLKSDFNKHVLFAGTHFDFAKTELAFRLWLCKIGFPVSQKKP